MKRYLFLNVCVAITLALGLAGSSAAGAAQAGKADVVFRNGFVYTVDASRSRAQAFAVRDGKFMKVAWDYDGVIAG